jgi:hypothetical protein
MTNRKLIILATPFFFAIYLTTAFGQQMADPTFDAKVSHPAYAKKNPKVLFDEAHNNFHKTTARYKPFVDLITNDGYVVTANQEKFHLKSLAGYDILVIANALGAERQNMPEASESPFTEEECDAVREWVRAGGALLFIADHAPFGAAAEKLASRFGVDMSKGHTGDREHQDSETGIATFLVYSRSNKLLADHPITRGRNATERVNNILTFTGQSLKGPAGSVAFLKLADTAVDRLPPGVKATAAVVDRLPNGDPIPPGIQVQNREAGAVVSAAGRSQGIAMAFGKGRVIVMGEAGMLSAQLIRGPAASAMGKEEIQMGMNRKGIDNRQLALNIMHWLSRLLK